MQPIGYVKLWRKSFRSGIMKDPVLWTFWCWCLMSAAYEPDTEWFNGVQVKLKPGQFVMSQRKVAETLGFTHQSVRTQLNKLKSTHMITQQVTHKYTIISIVNWDTYQSDNIKNNTLTNTLINTRLTHGQHTPNTPTLYKEDKNIRSKEYNIPNLQSGNGNDFFTDEELEEKPKPKKEPRKKFGEFKHVLLTEKEYDNLLGKFGIDLLTEAIKILDEGIEVKGYKYKNFNLALQKWPLERAREALGHTKNWTTWGEDDD